MRTTDEAGLIQQAQQGDRAALSELYSRHVARIFQYVRYRVGSDQAAEDITAEVFLKAIEALDTYNDYGAPLAAWLYRIAYARIVDYWRSNRRRQTAPLEDPLLQDGLLAPDDALTSDILQHRALVQALQRLTDDQQSVIILKFIQGYSNAEVAVILGKTEGAVKSLQRRALESLARALHE